MWPEAIPDDARDSVLDWFETRGRAFPFRTTTDAYEVLVLETMAQQTQIARASERWATFIERFPSASALASATPADVLREWRGLGYNRRALLLWRTAQVICLEHDGRVPDDVRALEQLPGVGPYTARAIAAFAYGRAVGPVDTNVRRVLSRIVGGRISPPAGVLQAIADRSVPVHRPREWTHALMDIGASLCRRTTPECGRCPLAAWCRYASSTGVGEPAGPSSMPPRRRQLAFPATTRWLRGRLLDRLRDALNDGWVTIERRIGVHDAPAIEAALAAMAADRLVERHPDDAFLARLPQSWDR